MRATGEGAFRPLPHGALLHRRTATEGDNPYAVGVNTHTEIQFPLPVHGYRPNHHALPAPLEGPGGGGVSTNTVQPETQETGAEDRAAGMVASAQGRTLSRSCAETGGKLFPLFCVV